jgi:hypothetical protein
MFRVYRLFHSKHIKTTEYTNIYFADFHTIPLVDFQLLHGPPPVEAAASEEVAEAEEETVAGRSSQAVPAGQGLLAVKGRRPNEV